ncbi:MAG: hypothetical protein R3F43_23920 [bacterium]
MLLVAGPGVEAPTQGDRERLAAFFGDAVEDRTAALDRMLTIAENRRRYARRFVDVRLPGEGWLARQGVEGAGISGEIGLHPGQAAHATAFFALDGRLLGERRMPVALPGLEILLHGPFTPTELFDDVEEDATFLAALDAAAAATPALIAGLARRLARHPGDAGRVVIRAWLDQARLGEPAARLRQQLAGVTPSPEAPAPWLAGLAEAADDPLRGVPLVATSSGSMASLALLAAWRADGRPLRFVDPGRPPLAVDPPLLCLDRDERGLLEAIFGAIALTSGEAAYAEAEARAAFLARPRARPGLDFDDATHLRVEAVAHGGFEGVVGLQMAASRRRGGWFSSVPALGRRPPGRGRHPGESAARAG